MKLNDIEKSVESIIVYSGINKRYHDNLRRYIYNHLNNQILLPTNNLNDYSINTLPLAIKLLTYLDLDNIGFIDTPTSTSSIKINGKVLEKAVNNEFSKKFLLEDIQKNTIKQFNLLLEKNLKIEIYQLYSDIQLFLMGSSFMGYAIHKIKIIDKK